MFSTGRSHGFVDELLDIIGSVDAASSATRTRARNRAPVGEEEQSSASAICGIRLGAPCGMPGPRFPMCTKLCAMFVGHQNTCSCEDHMVNPTAVFKAALKNKQEPEREDGGEVADVQVPGLSGSVFDLIDDHDVDEELVAGLFKAGYTTIEQLLGLSREKLFELGADAQLVLLLKGHQVKKRRLDDQLALRPSSAPRADMPELRFTQRGSVKTALALLATDDSKLQALQEVDKRRFANTTRKAKDSIWSTWECMARDVWQEHPLPLTEDLVRKQAAAFYAGGYRSAAQYFARAKEEHLKVFKKPVSVSVLKAIRDYTRSTERGIGPSKLKDSIPFEDIADQLVEIPPLQLPKDPEMCIWPAGMVCLGTWWLTRGIELAFAEVSHVSVNYANKTIAWVLPASKRDPKALGETRTQACVCMKVPSKSMLCHVLRHARKHKLRESEFRRRRARRRRPS